MINRTIAPSIELPSKLELPAIEAVVTKNNVAIRYLNVSSSDVVRMSIVFHAGSRNQSHPFTASALMNMLSEGSEKYTSSEFAEALDFYGIYYDTNVDRDYCMVTFSCLRKFLNVALDLFGQCLNGPVFDQNELDVYKQKRKQQLAIEREKPSYLARELFAQTIFGVEHPYGVVSSADEYDTLTRDHLLDYYNKYIVASNSFVVVSGKVESQDKDQIEAFVSSLKVGEKFFNGPIARAVSQKEATLERQGVQSSVRMGKLLFPKSHPNYVGMQLLSMILGGYFGSRLVQNIREDKGYTYGIFSTMISMEYEGYFAIASDVAAEFTQDTIGEIKSEIQRMQNELVDQEELDVVKNTIVGEMMRIIDGPFGIADVVIENIQSNLPADYLNGFLQEVRAISPVKIQELAQKYLDLETLSTVVVGKI